MSKTVNLVIVAGLIISIFVLELMTPRGYVEWILYIIPFMLASRVLSAPSIPYLAGLLTLLVIAGYFLSPSGPNNVAATGNRFFGIIVIWLMTHLLIQREKTSELVQRLAHHDPLTGLPNRRFFADIAMLESARARRYRQGMAILYLDADGFKAVNDSLGHDAGDEVLKQLAVRIKASIRESDTAARVGGDEFIFLLPALARKEEAAITAGKIVAAAAAPYSIGDRKVLITASIGISIYPDDSRDIDQLATQADSAMYAAKKQGGNTWRFYAGAGLRAAPGRTKR